MRVFRARILAFLIPALVVASMFQGRVSLACGGPNLNLCRPAATMPATCCVWAKLCAEVCADHGVPCDPAVPCSIPCTICCDLCVLDRPAAPTEAPPITAATLWPHKDPSYPLLEPVARFAAFNRFEIHPRPPDPTSARALLCCWLT